ncbi:MAG: phosphoribosylformylglycinamidine synthase, partial [Acidimicrobiia bacterium]|nr:phosphoribosylformylglycinamidine synthase [Acidimicrobiia bacterium]
MQVRSAGHPDERRIPAAAAQLGVTGLSGCRFWTVYHVEGLLSEADVVRLCTEVLVDPVTDEVAVGAADATAQVVEVAPLAGVTDGAARELERAAAVLGLPPLRAATARRYELSGELDEADIEVLTARLLANPTIERSHGGELAPSFSPTWEAAPVALPVPLAGLDDRRLADLSKQRMLSLDLTEMRAIRAHFVSCGRDPTDAELETLAQAWSEHCVHKTFKARIILTHTRANGRCEVTHHDGLLNALRRATADLEADWLRSVFVDNAGIVAFDDELDLAVKVETHNHPSALEPFGGANTGVGGVVRDILGVSARPIACTDVLCFGPEDLDEVDLPTGVLHPRRIRDGVVAGIGDYGNKLGLPTVNGAVLYDPGYMGNPLVFCGALGLLPAGSHPTAPQAGDRIIVIGGRTGRDGIGGATFSSAGLDAAVVGRAGSAVQIGDPIVEKGCIEVIERARDRG